MPELHSKWKKTSGFKKGLLTDIHMGDNSYSEKMVTTTNCDFVKKAIEQGVKPAGKKIGFDAQNKSVNHIILGDGRFGISASKSHVDLPKAPAQTAKNAPKSLIAAKYHSKSGRAMSSSHIGLQTKQDVPIDGNHFHSFHTTAAESFKDPGPPLMAQKVVDGRPSHFSLGDSSQSSYSTEQETSFIKHPDNAYKRKPQNTIRKKTFVLGQDPKADIQSRYETTNSLAFFTTNSPALESVCLKNSEQSSICLGNEHTERRNTGKSVTKLDYVQKEFIPIDLIPPKTSGIIKALAPTNASEKIYETSTSSSFRPPESGSFQKNFDGNVELRTSAVPHGDSSYYNFSKAKSTSSEAYGGWNRAFPTHPKLGAQMTVSNISLGSPDANYIESYVSTTQEAFQKYSKIQIRGSQGTILNPYSTSNIPQMKSGCIPISTTRSHYLPPVITSRTKPIIPAASSNLVNPRGGEESLFETTTQQYYKNRAGITGSEISKIIQKGGRESSIVFGDRNHFCNPKTLKI